MKRVVEEKGDARVKMAVEEIRCMVASRIKCGRPSSSGSSGSSSSSSSPPSSGSRGDDKCGAGTVMGN